MAQEDIFKHADDANMYAEPYSPPPSERPIEEILSETRGGDPIEWIPEAEAIVTLVRNAIKTGVPLCTINPVAESGGIFEGYHEVKIYFFDAKSHDEAGEIKLLPRIVYANSEQASSGKFTVPREGLFALNESSDNTD